jgi:hypothetical protein
VGGGRGTLADLRSLRASPGFARLLAVRLAGQFGDGALQAGLAALFFFAPERASTPGGVAAAFAVLLGPFTLVGPWVGVLLDRWPRREVLVWGNSARAILALAIAAIMVWGGIGPAVYGLALLSLSINRLLLAGLSAAQPRLVEPAAWLTANSVAPTAGTIASGVGAVAGLAIALAGGQERRWAAIGLAAVAFAAAAACGRGFAGSALGPDQPAGTLGAALRSLMGGLALGARHLWERRTPAAAIGAVAASRVCYGLVFMAAILISRNLLAPPADSQAGIATFTALLAFAGAGFGLAAVATPLAHARIAPERWIAICLALASASQLAIAASYRREVLFGAALVLSAAVQGMKIAADTIVQRDVADPFRGRAFALYDVAFNGAFLLAAAIGALALPVDGHSTALFAALAAAYAAQGAAYSAVSGPGRGGVRLVG